MTIRALIGRRIVFHDVTQAAILIGGPSVWPLPREDLKTGVGTAGEDIPVPEKSSTKTGKDLFPPRRYVNEVYIAHAFGTNTKSKRLLKWQLSNCTVTMRIAGSLALTVSLMSLVRSVTNKHSVVHF